MIKKDSIKEGDFVYRLNHNSHIYRVKHIHNNVSVCNSIKPTRDNNTLYYFSIDQLRLLNALEVLALSLDANT